MAWARSRGFNLRGERRGAGKIVAEYDYRDDHGTVQYQVVRLKPKDFRQRRPDGRGGWNWKMIGVKPLPYRLPEMLAEPQKPVFVVEGEKDADRLTREGLIATCNHGGAGKWRPELCRWFEDRLVMILPDNDEAGRRHAEDVSRKLHNIARRTRIVQLPNLPPKGDVSDWLDAGHTILDLRRLAHDAPAWQPAGGTNPETAEADPDTEVTGVTLDDFQAYMPQHNYIFMPTGDAWPAGSVNARINPVPLTDPEGKRVVNTKGEIVLVPASVWLDRHRPVEQMTWSPGEPQIIAGRLTSHAGWIEREGARVFNLYRAPVIASGNAADATRWLEHVERVFPDDYGHIVKWLAHRVQRPGEKINHAIVLGGDQGIGKDTLLEPVKKAVGPWNWNDVAPTALCETFNPFAKSVILRINEGHDLGELNRYQFYEALKVYAAAPPDVLRVNDKHIRHFYVQNVCGVVITTNHKTDGIYLPADDRRHFVGWSGRTKEDFDQEYWQGLWHWYYDGGLGHVAAYLAGLDLSDFDPKAPPPKTAAFWAIVNAGRAPEDEDLENALDKLRHPEAFVLDDLVERASGSFGDWLRDRKNRRIILHRLESCGYTRVRNPDAKNGLWRIDSEKQAAYARSNMTLREQIEAVRARKGRDEDDE